jgi:hypothetical protein
MERRFTVSQTASVEVKMDVPISRLQDLLISAFEGGSNYWYRINEFGKPNGEPETWPNRTNRENVYKHVDYPANPGGYVMVEDVEGGENKVYRLDLDTMKKGLEIMSKLEKNKGGHHIYNFLEENDDAETGDVYLQCCLFGEIIYG